MATFHDVQTRLNHLRHATTSTLCYTLVLLTVAAAVPGPPAAQATEPGYFRFPALHADTIVFTAEGDLWRIGLDGGSAQRLTSHPGQETLAAISPDGQKVAFSAEYEGPMEVYVMPLTGGLPERLTWEGERAKVVGWTPAGEVLYSTRHFATLPDRQLIAIDPSTHAQRRLPLTPATEGCFFPEDETLFFTRQSSQTSFTKRYVGGTAAELWRFTPGTEATPLTADFPGTSHQPQCGDDGRLYFVSDRPLAWTPPELDARVDNRLLSHLQLWSMQPDGSDLRRHTNHQGWDVKRPSLQGGRATYQLGADLYVLDLNATAGSEPRRVDIRLSSDFDQMRETWQDDPADYLTSTELSPNGDRVVLTSRGRVFVAPVKSGRLVAAGRDTGVRYRQANFLPTKKGDPALVAFSDADGEVELWRLDARGVEPPAQITDGGSNLRMQLYPSPDGHRAAIVDRASRLVIVTISGDDGPEGDAPGTEQAVTMSPYFGFSGIEWSPDSRWLAYAMPNEGNTFSQIYVYSLDTGTSTAVTSDRYPSAFPTWSLDGQWLYFISARHLESSVRSPWGYFNPAPHLDKTSKIYALALQPGQRFPFRAPDELSAAQDETSDEDSDKPTNGEDKEDKKDKDKSGVRVDIDFDDLSSRLFEVPIAPGSYDVLAATTKHLYFFSDRNLTALPIGHEDIEPVSIFEGASFYDLSADGKKLLVRQGETLFVGDANGKKLDRGETKVSLDGWTFPIDPREERRQMFVEAWRLARDYFYDPSMHGIDWQGVLDKYLPVSERVTDRAELSDLFGDLIGELSVLHAYVRRGDFREGPDDIAPAFLGARLERDEAGPDGGGYRVAQIYRTDPDRPDEAAPLTRPGVDVQEGDLLLSINGIRLSESNPGTVLRNQAGKQVLLEVLPAGQQEGAHETRRVIVEPINMRAFNELRYDHWEYERRLQVEEWSGGKIGYVHLRAMGGGNYSEWARHFFPVIHRQGLIVDVRHNRGGNIDSWILGSLLRQPWMWWKPANGMPYSNMQYAFGGHVVTLSDETTASDGEAFAEGFRRLGLGEVIGVRSWGGEVWLTSSNTLVDNGVVTAPEFGVYGPEGEWLIEGHGVVPDQVVENLPHATFQGEDAQLRAAVDHLLRLIEKDPPTVPEPPPFPDMAPHTP